MKLRFLTCITIGIILTAGSIGNADDPQRTIRVTGEGKVTAVPDMAIIRTGVVSQASKAVEAMEQNSAISKQIMVDLEQMKIAERDIQTSRFNVQPEYEQGPRGQRTNKIVGYRVTNQVTVRVHDLAKVGKLLDTLIRSGSNRISGVNLGVKDSSDLMNEARVNAIKNARARANIYAEAAGVEVGKVISIDEQQAAFPRTGVFGRAMEMSGDVPIAAGEMEFSTTINVMFELVDP